MLEKHRLSSQFWYFRPDYLWAILLAYSKFYKTKFHISTVLSLNGMNEPFFFGSVSIFMQFPRASRLLLILAPSCMRIPRLSETAALSEPAKSIINNLGDTISSNMSFDFYLFSIYTYIMQCERLENWLELFCYYFSIYLVDARIL